MTDQVNKFAKGVDEKLNFNVRWSKKLFVTEPTYSIEDIKQFMVAKTGCKDIEVRPDIDIINDLGCSGDDFDELIREYVKKFDVKMDGFLWYFHTEEEGHFNSIGRIFFKAPYERVKHIPVTPILLLDSANQGKWLMTYPEHSLPKHRYDIWINQGLILVFIVFIIYKCAR